MFHINRMFIHLAILCLLGLSTLSVTAQDSPLTDTPLDESVEIHIIPGDAPVEIWHTQGSRIIEGWLSASVWQKRTAKSAVSPTQAEVIINPLPFTNYVSIWRTEGSRIVEGWISSPAE